MITQKKYRKAIFSLATVLLLSIFSAGAAAGELLCNGKFDQQTVRLIVGHKAGGGFDLAARVFAAHYERHTGADMAVENWPAGNGAIGLREVINAKPDGLTMGLLDASKHVLVHALDSDQENALDVFGDLTALARISRSRYVLLARKGANIKRFDDLLTNINRPLLGTKNYSSGGFIVMNLISEMFNIDFETVAGLGGTRKRMLALMRGDIDIAMSNFSSVAQDLERGELIPLLQVSATQISNHPALIGVPLLAGPEGVATLLDKSYDADLPKQAEGILGYSAVGRLIVGPQNYSPEMKQCLQSVFQTILTDERFVAEATKAGVDLDIATGTDLTQELATGAAALKTQVPALKKRLDAL